jgi:DNA-binding CsgD family transcriptional regulator
MEPPMRAWSMQGSALLPIVGRAEELHALNIALDEALAGQGVLWVLAGPPGIGKTRLAQEIEVYARLRGATVATGRCTEDEGSLSYLPFVDAFRGVLLRSVAASSDLLDEHASIIARLQPQMKERRPTAKTSQISPETERYVLFEAVTTFIRNLAQESGLVLLVEDLHWADRPSLLLLQYLARQLKDSKVLVIGTFRDVEVSAGNPLSVVLGNLRRDGDCRRLTVGGLSEEHVREILDALVQPGAPPELVRALHRQAEGNPFFVREMVLHLIQLGVIHQDDSGWVSELSLDEVGLPEGVKDAIGRRLARLSDACRSLLRQAAVVGGEFRHSLLAEMSGHVADDLLDLMDEALAARLVLELPRHEAAYAFSHALTRQTLLDELSRARRQRLHRQVGEAMEREYRGNLRAHMPELAYHFFAAAPLGAPEKAIEYATGAATAASAALGYEEAARLYEMALDALDLSEALDQDLRCELLLALGEAEMSSGRVEPAREVFGKAADCARALRSPKQLARAAIGSGGAWIYGGDPVVWLLEEAAGVLGDDDQNLRVRVLTRLVWELGAQGLGYDPQTHERRLATSREALDAARRLDDPAALAHALRARHDALWGPDYTKERLDLATEAMHLAEATGLLDVEFEARHGRIGNLMELGDVESALEEFDVYSTSADKLKQPIYLFHALVIRAKLALHSGEMERAERLSVEALAMGQRAGYPAVRTVGVQLFALRREQGRLEELEASAKRIVEVFPTVPGFAASLASLYMEIEREADARAVFERLALDGFEAIPKDWFWLISMSLLAHVCSYLRDARRAGALYQLLLPFAQRNVCVVNILSTGSASRGLGVLAATMSRWGEAEHHFEDALEMNGRTGARSAFAWTQYDYAQMLVVRRHQGDRKKAYVLLTQALGTARDLGLRRLEDKVTCLLASRRSLTPVYPDRLTRREVDVLRLIAEGASNSEISERLVLSIRTVERHITNVYNKINARGRADATAYAMRHGLAPTQSEAAV